MNILLLTTHMNLGGIGIYLFSLALGLAQRGHKVVVVSCGGDLVGKLEAAGAKHIRVDLKTKSVLSPKLFKAREQIEKIIKEEKIEIIHAHTRVTQVLAQLIYKKLQTPFITTCHGFFKARLSRKLFPCWGSHCVAVSEAVREHLVNDLRLKKEKVTVVHNGIEIDKFSPEKFNREEKEKIKSEYGLKPKALVIGTVARLSSVKGQKYLIQAMPLVLQECPGAQLILVGDGPEKEYLTKLARELKIERSVIFASSTFDTSRPLAVMDVFVFPSVMEGLGLAIIEAQSMGLAVVASDVGGIYTLVKDGVNGFLVEPGKYQLLAEKISQLLKRPDLTKQLGACGRKQAQAEFNLDKMCSGIEAVYQKVLAR